MRISFRTRLRGFHTQGRGRGRASPDFAAERAALSCPVSSCHVGDACSPRRFRTGRWSAISMCGGILGGPRTGLVLQSFATWAGCCCRTRGASAAWGQGGELVCSRKSTCGLEPMLPSRVPNRKVLAQSGVGRSPALRSGVDHRALRQRHARLGADHRRHWRPRVPWVHSCVPSAFWGPLSHIISRLFKSF